MADKEGTTLKQRNGTRSSFGPASVSTDMVNAELRMLHAPDGTPVCNVSFDLSAQQLDASAKAAEAIRLERHRHQALSTDDVLALRELTGLSDELHLLAEHGAHATVVMTLARFVALHDGLVEWVHAAEDRGWMREEDQEVFPFVTGLIDPMAQLRADALQAMLGEASSHAADA